MVSSLLLPFINLSPFEKIVTIQAKVDLVLSNQIFKLRSEELFSEFPFMRNQISFSLNPHKWPMSKRLN